MGNKQVILLLSGGIDSTTLLAKLISENYNVIAISFQYHQKHGVELLYAKKNAIKYGVVNHHIIELDKELFQSSALVNKELDVSTYKKSELPKEEVNTYVPFRNLLFISTALSFAETLNVNEIYLAINSDDSNNYWDCKVDFIKNINKISSSCSPIRVITPFINFSKKEVVQLAIQLKVDLNNTITCYQPILDVECGICLSCITKSKALNEAFKIIKKTVINNRY